MNYTEELVKFLYAHEFKLCKYPGKILMIRELPDEINMVEIIPEPLRGQEQINYRQSEEKTNTVVNKIMLRANKKVDRLTLALFDGAPDPGVRKEISDCDHIWCTDVRDSIIYIYENQIADFHDLKKSLEECLRQSKLKIAEEKKQERLHYITPVNLGIILINIAVFLILFFLGNTENADFMAGHGALTWESVIVNKEYYRLLTCMFLHFGADHLLQNMLLLFVLGSRLEKITGQLRYLIIYIGAGLIGAVCSLLFTLSKAPYTVCAGASGAIFGVMGGLLFLILKDFFEKKRRRVKEIGMVGILFMTGAALYFGFTTAGVDNMAHVGGLAGGFLLTALLMIGE